jgi:D-alanyl-D-alanine carboxypeptidase
MLGPGAARAERVNLAPLVARFQAELDRLQRETGIPGATAAFILPDGRAVACAAGYSDKEAKTPMRADARMLSGSVGKTFVAAVAISLAQEGKLGLDDKISKWLGKEDWFGRLPNGKDITLRQLLTHSSGLRDHVYDPAFVKDVHERVAGENPDPDFYFKPRELVGFILDKKPLFPAGKGYSYSDTGYILAGMIIEKSSGGAYYGELKKRILDPLKLSRTVPANRLDIPGLAAGYLSTDNPLGLPSKTLADGKMRFNPANEWTGGGLASNPLDLVRWAKALYEGKALKKPYLEDLLSSGFKGKDAKGRYGLGVAIMQTSMGPVYGHGGWFPGYLTALFYFPAQKVALSMQVNTDANEAALVRSFNALAKVMLESLKGMGPTK